MENTFQDLGFFKEYYVNGRFFGTIKCEKDREVVGYNGRTEEVLKEKVVLDNGKKLIIGIKVQTVLYPLNGKFLNK